jgi:hypothetical protein
MDDAVKYFSEIYKAVPPTVIKDAIQYCIKNPEKYPEDWKDIDLKKVPKPKRPKETVIDGAVEIFDSPDDPRIKVIKHRDGATLLTAEEAVELQAKVQEAVQKQESLKDKMKEAKKRVAHK